jgi:hypothetical protein
LPNIVNANGVLNSFQLTDVNAGPAATLNGVLYAQFDELFSFSGGTGATGVGLSSTPLPVKLVSFKGRKAVNTVQLTWATSSEQNVARFEVERSTDASKFTSIGSTTSKGGLNVNADYAMTDTRPVNGLNYYRLRTVDNDGKVEHSQVITVVFGKSFATTVYPNPVKSDLNLVVSSEDALETTVRIFDIQGKEVWSSDMSVLKATQVKTLDVNNLPQGMYSIRIEGANNEILDVQKFIKVD